MRYPTVVAALFMMLPVLASAEEESTEAILEKHREGSEQVADRQDELSADVQQLTIEQTVPKVIELLSEVEDIMDEATDNLVESETGGVTIAAQTEVIEKIYEAAKAKQQQGGSCKSGSAMMDMMERMMGKNPDGKKPGDGKGDQPGESGGKGQTGDSDSASELASGGSGGATEARRVPKASGNAGRALPEEFNKALDAYNRGAVEKIK